MRVEVSMMWKVRFSEMVEEIDACVLRASGWYTSDACVVGATEPPALLMRTVRWISERRATMSLNMSGAVVHVDASMTRVRNCRLGKVFWRDRWTSLSLEGLRPWRTMLKPREASSWARARPSPEVVPVMRAQGCMEEASLLLVGDGAVWRNRLIWDGRRKGRTKSSRPMMNAVVVTIPTHVNIPVKGGWFDILMGRRGVVTMMTAEEKLKRRRKENEGLDRRYDWPRLLWFRNQPANQRSG